MLVLMSLYGWGWGVCVCLACACVGGCTFESACGCVGLHVPRSLWVGM